MSFVYFVTDKTPQNSEGLPVFHEACASREGFRRSYPRGVKELQPAYFLYIVRRAHREEFGLPLVELCSGR